MTYKTNDLLPAFLLLVMLLVASCAAQPPTPFTNPQGTPYPPVPTIDRGHVRLGRQVYQATCAVCHGANAEGAINWMTPDTQGNQLSPPHDDSGHTWHHPDEVLFGITKNGLVAPYAPPGYQSDMPGFGGTLSDAEIRAVLAYIASRWSSEVRKARAEMLQHRPRR